MSNSVQISSIATQLHEVFMSIAGAVSSTNELLKPVVRQAIENSDSQLLEQIASNKELEEMFFHRVGDKFVFRQDRVLQFLDSKEFFSGSYTSYRNKIGLSVDGRLISDLSNVVLEWPYKDCLLEGGISKDKTSREEIFVNPYFASKDANRLSEPKAFTNFKLLGAEQISRNDVDNIREKASFLLKGNNLFSLFSILPKFRGKLDAIYIDPPYNTSGDDDEFAYNNSFKHSTWYTFMKNRLEIAKELLSETGIIAIAIDHVELFYLGVLADEIFHRDNRLGIVTVVHKPEGRNQEKFFGTSTEYMMVYAKDAYLAEFIPVALDVDKKAAYSSKDSEGHFKLANYRRDGGGSQNLRVNKSNMWYPIYVSGDLETVSLAEFDGSEAIWPTTTTGQERSWKTKPETFDKALYSGRIVAERDKAGRVQVYEKYYEHEKGQVIKTHWDKKAYHAIHSGTKVLEKIVGKGKFSYPKSIHLVEDILRLILPKNGIVLDFFAGSGTTGHAVINLNHEDGGHRRFILCEQMNYADTVTTVRILHALNEKTPQPVVIAELAAKNFSFVQQLKSAKSSEQVRVIWREIESNGFISHKVTKSQVLAALKDPSVDPGDLRNLVLDCLDQNHLFVNTSEMFDQSWGVPPGDADFTGEFFGSQNAIS